MKKRLAALCVAFLAFATPAVAEDGMLVGPVEKLLNGTLKELEIVHGPGGVEFSIEFHGGCGDLCMAIKELTLLFLASYRVPIPREKPPVPDASGDVPNIDPILDAFTVSPDRDDDLPEPFTIDPHAPIIEALRSVGALPLL